MKGYEEDYDYGYDLGYEDIEDYETIDNFDFLFDTISASRGENYYKNGLVINLVKKDNKYKAKVIGTYPYEVEIETEDDKIVGMKCNCPYYIENHNNCKHMYAVLKSIKNEEYEEATNDPCECPVCKTKENVVPLIYGGITKSMMEKLKQKKAKYGGEKTNIETFGKYKFYKKWYCKNCHNEIYNNGELKIAEAYKHLGKIEDVIIDHPFGSVDSKYGYIYPVNFGHILNKIGENEKELDTYVLGEYEMLDRFTGKCVAIIQRNNDEYKLVIVPNEKTYDENQIKALTEFQERFFNSKVLV